MNNRMKFISSRGFSLIEVLVAVVILSVGLLALASLQLGLIRSSGDTKAQTIAAALAKAKIEELRGFQTLEGYRLIVAPANEALADNNGSLGGMNFTRATTVTRYVYNKGAPLGFETVGNTLTDAAIDALSVGGKVFVPGKDFKRITVVVGWANSAGVSSSISLEDIIDSLDPTDIAAITKKTTSGVGPRKVQVKITDPALDNMVIPIALGSGVNSAATNPKPNVVKGVNTVETQFDVLTYSGLNNGTATVQARVETLIVGCTCDKSEKPATTVRGKRPTYWDGSRYTVPLDVASYSPPAAADTQSASVQSDKCIICCRDHHDPATTTGATFSPLGVVKTNGVVTTEHSHHVDKVTTTEAATTYREACRVIRSDGIWSVAADLRNDYFGLLATGNGTTADTAVPDSTSTVGSVTGGAVARYQNFVLDYMKARYVVPTPTNSAAQATYNTVGNPASMAAGSPYSLDLPASISVNLKYPNTLAGDAATAGKWLHSRGLYTDYLEQEATDAITRAKADTVCNTATTTPTVQTAAEVLRQCILRLLPFTSINLTEIAEWGPQTVPFNVTNNDYSESRTANDPVRGKVTTAAASASTTQAITQSRRSNSGLLDLSFDAISPTDAGTTSDPQSFAVGGGTPPASTGNGTFYVNLSMPAGFVVGPPLATSYITGAQPSVACGSVLNNTCTVQNGTVAAGLGIAGTMSIVIGGYNKQSDAGTSTTALTGCTGTGNAAGFVSPNNIKNSTTEVHNRRVCLNYGVTTASITNGSGASIQNPPSNSTMQTESTTIGFPLINATPTDTVAVAFSLQSSNELTPTSCTFTCDAVQNGNCRTNGQNKTNFTAVFPACP